MLDNFLPLFIHPSCWCHFLLLAPNSDLSFTTHSGNVLVLPGIRCPGEYPLLYLGRIPPAGGRLLMYLNPKGICAQRSFFILNPYYHLSSPFFSFRNLFFFFFDPEVSPTSVVRFLSDDTPPFPPLAPLFHGNAVHFADRKSLWCLMNRSCLSSLAYRSQRCLHAGCSADITRSATMIKETITPSITACVPVVL